MHLASVISLDPQGNVTCTSSGNGAPPSPRIAGECGFLYGTGAAQAIRERGVPGDLILIFTMVPEGAAPAPGNEETGAELAYEDTAHLVIAPDGTVAECRPGRANIVGTPLPMRMPQPCWRRNGPIVTPAAGQETRDADTAIRIYFRRRSAS